MSYKLKNPYNSILSVIAKKLKARQYDSHGYVKKK